VFIEYECDKSRIPGLADEDASPGFVTVLPFHLPSGVRWHYPLRKLFELFNAESEF